MKEGKGVRHKITIIRKVKEKDIRTKKQINEIKRKMVSGKTKIPKIYKKDNYYNFNELINI